MNDVLVLPTGPLADASLALVRSTESRPIADHSIRSFIFARLLAEHEGALNDADYDEELLFAAAVMHDLAWMPKREALHAARPASKSRAPTWLPRC